MEQGDNGKQKIEQAEISFELVNSKTAKSPTLKDVYGSEQFKTSLEDIISSIQYGKVYSHAGVKRPKSFMFTGKPGTGKTYSLRAIVNELALLNPADYIMYMPYDIGNYGTAYINMNSVIMQDYFNMGYNALNCKKCKDVNVSHVIYWLDECDTLMSQRGIRHQSKEDDKLLTTLMKNLQEINDADDERYIFIATNFPDMLDKASIRSGRINQKIEFPMPDYESRYSLFGGYINKANSRAKSEMITGYDIGELAKQSDGLSCSDISTCIDTVIQNRIKEALRTKSEKIILLSANQEHILTEINKLKKNTEIYTKKIGYL